MREILFRGKRVANGDWKEGSYVHQYCCHLIYLPNGVDSEHGFDYYHVIPETVGQFTGLTDKNGKKIFEGDIVEVTIVRDICDSEDVKIETGAIEYDKIGMIGLIMEYYDDVPIWSDVFQELELSDCINDFWFEVIGNIHDNPELLRKEGDI